MESFNKFSSILLFFLLSFNLSTIKFGYKKYLSFIQLYIPNKSIPSIFIFNASEKVLAKWISIPNLRLTML